MKNKKLFWAVIPARQGSKSIFNKNILKINGHPLIAYSIIQAKKSKFIDKVIFTSDSKKYLNIAKKYGADILHLRSKKNSKDNSSDKSFFNELIYFLKKNSQNLPDFFVHLRPTCPIRKIKTLNNAIELFLKKNKNCSSMRSVSPMSETSYKTFEIKKNTLRSICNLKSNIEIYNKPKEFFKSTYFANGYIDIIKLSNIVKKNILHGDKVMPYVVKELIRDIDDKNDLSYVKYLMKNKKYFKNY